MRAQVEQHVWLLVQLEGAGHAGIGFVHALTAAGPRACPRLYKIAIRGPKIATFAGPDELGTSLEALFVARGLEIGGDRSEAVAAVLDDVARCPFADLATPLTAVLAEHDSLRLELDMCIVSTEWQERVFKRFGDAVEIIKEPMSITEFSEADMTVAPGTPEAAQE